MAEEHVEVPEPYGKLSFPPSSPGVRSWEAPADYLEPDAFNHLYFIQCEKAWIQHKGKKSGPRRFGVRLTKEAAAEWFSRWCIVIPPDILREFRSTGKPPPPKEKMRLGRKPKCPKAVKAALELKEQGRLKDRAIYNRVKKMFPEETLPDNYESFMKTVRRTKRT